MRRSRTALTAWPAFADLMTVLAVLGLAIAAGVAGVDAPDGGEDPPPAEDPDQSPEAQLAAARERIAALELEIEDLKLERRLGSFPCLGTRPGSSTAPVPLLRIVVGSGYHLTRLWPAGADVQDIPRLEEAVARGPLQEGDFRMYAGGMYAHGDADSTYGRPCRFWVELRKGATTSQTTFSRARSIVEQYFLLSNSSEVIRILTAPE